MKRIAAPPIMEETEKMDLSGVISGMDISRKLFETSPEGTAVFRNMTFDGCVFRGIDLSRISFEKVSLTDCVFEVSGH